MRWRRPFVMPLAPLGRLVLPGAKAAEKRVCVVAYAASGGQLVEVLYIASAEHHVIGLERGDEMYDHVFDMLPPFLLAVSGQPPQANVVLVGAFAIGQMPELHRFDDAIHDHRRPQPGP